ncbi:MAG TPA: hypothetical protein VIV15_08710 [Anaerolineales bacterium]
MLVNRLQVLPFEDNPFLIKTREELALIGDQGGFQFRGSRRFSQALNGTGIDPSIFREIQGYSHLIGDEKICLGGKGFTDAPECMAQIIAGAFVGGVRPEETRQLFAAVGNPRIQCKICKQGLGRARRDPHRVAIGAYIKAAKQPNFEHSKY